MSDFGADFLDRLRTGCADAARLLDDGVREPLRRFCLGYLADLHAAEDAVQEVFAKVLAGTDRPDNLRVWLFTVARNHCLNVLRADGRRRDAATLPSGSVLGRQRTGFLTGLVRQEQQERIDAEFAALPETEREVLRLRYADGLSRAEIAAVVGVAESVVKSRLFEGLQRLRARVGPPSAP